uniref:Uncharacterized protein n=1 Tax=Plectus sambesii TaxID=2011161 RepID=A0A914XPQ3_9BILA
MFHQFLRRLLHDERFIQRLSESSVMRAAARFAASLFFRGRESATRSIERLNNSAQTNAALEAPIRRFQQFSSTLSREYKKAMEEKGRLK